jgi:membrane protease YdiL (CAAX protease family)
MALFWILSFAIAWALTLPPALAQIGVIDRSPVPYGLTMLIGLAPIVAAAVAAARGRQGRTYWRSLSQLPRPGWTALLAAMLPPLLLALAYLAHWALGRPIQLAFDGEVVVMGLVWLVLAFGEEAGWRGFALSRLVERHGFWLGSLILGLTWCVWHYPRLLGSPHLGSLSETLPLIGLFSVQIIISNFILCWLYFRSGRSVIAATLFHASFNVVATAYFLAATDVIVTGLLLLAVLAIACFDPGVRRRCRASRPVVH